MKNEGRLICWSPPWNLSGRVTPHNGRFRRERSVYRLLNINPGNTASLEGEYLHNLQLPLLL